MSARCTALMLARCTTADLELSSEVDPPAWTKLAHDLWVHIARAIPVTLAGKGWVQCPYYEWMVTPRQSFPDLHRDFVRRLKAATQRLRPPAELYGEDDVHEHFQDEMRAADKAWKEVSAGMSASLPNLLGDRHYNRFGLFSSDVGSVRSDAALGVKMLGCLRSGWPLDKAPALYPSLFDDDATDENMHSRCFCTLEGLFAVDWSVSCSSTARSGQRFRPMGNVRGSRAQVELQQLEYAAQYMRRLVAQGTAVRLFEEMGLEAKRAEVLQQLSAEHEVGELEEVVEDGSGTSAEGGGVVTTRWQLLGHPYMAPNGPDVHTELMAMKQAIQKAGNSLAEFRLLICFDN